MADDETRQEKHEYRAALRVSSRFLHLTDLTALLGEPTSGHDIGDPVSQRNPDGGHYEHSQWILDSQLDRSRPLDEHIKELVTFAERHRDRLESLRAKCEIDIFCGIFSGDDAQGGFELGPALSRRLADLELLVGFDIY